MPSGSRIAREMYARDVMPLTFAITRPRTP
jgi:hypothetical protein